MVIKTCFKHFISGVMILGASTFRLSAETPDFNPGHFDNSPLMWVFVLLLSVSAMAGLLLLIYLLAKQHHARAMAMISKGIYEPRPVNWPFLTQAAGLLIIFLIPGIIVLYISESDLLHITGLGILLFMGGMALLLISRLANRKEMKQSKG